MKLHKTAKALLARGISSDLAVNIANMGYTISDLKQLDILNLKKLGFNDRFIEDLRSEKRPPIPNQTVNELLFESRFCCCVCRNNSLPVVIHHIIPWEESHSHDKSILAVLCSIHHDEAHTKHELSITLTPERIFEFKNSWLNEVKINDQNAILGVINKNYACWDFFNLNRIFELSSNFNICLNKMKTYDYLLSYGYIEHNGFLTPINSWPDSPNFYWLDMINGMYICNYVSEIFLNILSYLPFKIIDIKWNKSVLKSLCHVGDFIVIQGGFYFQNIETTGNIKKTFKLAYKKKRNTKIEFIFDPWYCTSSSAKNDHLTGHRIITAFAIIREIQNTKNLFNIKCTVLAIGSCFHSFFDGRFFLEDSN